MNKYKRSRYSILLFIILLIITFSMGCGRKSTNNSVSNSNTRANSIAPSNDGFGGFGESKKEVAVEFSKANPAAYNVPVEKSPTAAIQPDAAANAAPKITSANRKVVLTGTMDIETNKYDKAVNGILKITEQAGGYIENSTMSGDKAQAGDFLENRTANYILRIPAAKFQYIISSLGNLGTIINKTTNGEDVTYQFYDNQARLQTLRVKQARILEILKKTKAMQDVLSAENELQNTIYEIENLTGTQKKLSSLVEFSTLTISVREVYNIKKLVKKPATLVERMSYSFKESIKLLVDIIKGTIVVLVAILPFAIILIIILALTWYFIKRRRNHKAK
jgi:hypothetical protein